MMKTIWICPACDVELQEKESPEFSIYRDDLDWLDSVNIEEDYGPSGEDEPEYTIDFPNGEYTIDGKVYCPQCVGECATCSKWIFIHEYNPGDYYSPGYSLFDELHNQSVCVDCYEELVFCGYCGEQYKEFDDLAKPCSWSIVETSLQNVLIQKGIIEEEMFLPEEFLRHLEEKFTEYVFEEGRCVSCVDQTEAEKDIFPELDLALLGEDILSDSSAFEFYNPAQT